MFVNLVCQLIHVLQYLGSHAKVRLLRETRNVLYEMHALLLVHCFLVPRPVIQRFVMAAHADFQFSSLLIMYDEGHSTTWISTISIYAFITWECKPIQFHDQLLNVSSSQHSSSFFQLSFLIDCMERRRCQISKKGIYYSSIQGHLLYSHTLGDKFSQNLIQISITFTGEAEQSSFAVCQMSEMLYAVLLFPLFFLIFTLYILFSSGHLVANEPKQLGIESKRCLEHVALFENFSS
ncbi:hypothetical protein Tsp_03301 [Trichinella spiralis]|uniref:hypothetical protein n=1 Tax=Trichinella spiralis TaxID=6334 RepID=UPI0001EFC7BF|nr:hypothetical protein Tsp_03301 [Trichinella spiralis]